MISVLVPSRGRPEMAERMEASAYDTASGDIEVLFYLNDNDDSVYNVKHSYVGPDQPTAHSWNFLASKARGDIFMLGADDILFRTAGWDGLEGPEIALHSFDDGRDKVGHPHPALTRKWVETVGYFVYPELFHWYVDTWNVAMAEGIGRLIYHPDILIEHMTFKENKSVVDETYRRIRRGNINARDRNVFETHEQRREEDISRLLCACS